MANLGETFTASEAYSGTGTYQPLPPDWYEVTISSAELKTTKDGTGQYVKIRYDVTGPTFQGRAVFGNLNIKNQSIKAEEIGRAHLKDIIRAAGLSNVTDTDQLIGARLCVKVDVRQADEKYAAQNEVKAFRSVNPDSAPAFKGTASPPAASSDPGTASKKAAPPWAKK